MAVTADQVVVELEARISKYMSDVAQAETRFTTAANTISTNSQKMGNVTGASFDGALSSIGRFSTQAQTSLKALATGFATVNTSIGSSASSMDAFFTPLQIKAAAATINMNKLATETLGSHNAMNSSWANLATKTDTSFAAMTSAANQFSTAIQNMPDMSKAMANPFRDASDYIDGFTSQTHNLQFNLGNLSAQFNDIGVTAAGGMSPMLIALQQGTQLSQAFAGQNLGQVAKGIGAAFMSVVSPVSLLTIGVVAGTAALIQWGMSALSAEDDSGSFEKSLDKLDETLTTLKGHLDQLKDFEGGAIFGATTDEVRELTEALVALDRIAEMKNLTTALKSLNDETIGASWVQKIIGEGTKLAVGSANYNPDVTGDAERANYDALAGGKGLSFDDYKTQTGLIETAAAAGNVEEVVTRINDLLKEMSSGSGGVSGLSSGMLTLLGTMGEVALKVAKTEAQFNGSAEAAKALETSTKEWAKVYDNLDAAIASQAEQAKAIAEARQEETVAAQQSLTIAEAEAKFGADSAEAAKAKRDVQREILESKLLAQDLDREAVDNILEMADKTEALSVLTNGWKGIVDSVAAAKEKVLEKMAAITEATKSETLQAEQGLQLAQAAAQFSEDTAKYAEVKAEIDRDNLRIALEAQDIAEGTIDAIIGIVTETDNVTAATAAWQSNMVSVKSVIAGIISDLASIGGGIISNVSASVEVAALKAGKTRAQAARERAQFDIDAQYKAASMTNSPYEKLIAWGQNQVETRKLQIADELATETAAAAEREKIAKKAASGGGSSKKKTVKKDEFTSIYDDIEAMDKETAMLNSLELGYSQYSSKIAIARKEYEILQALYKEGVKVTPEVTKKVHLLAASYVASAEAAKLAAEKHSEFQQDLEAFRSTAEDAFTGLVTGAMSFSDALGNVASQLAKMYASKAFTSIFGDNSVGGGFLDTIGSALFGGFREGGGDVSAGKAYVVGEKRPELFVPNQSGTIIPDISGIGSGKSSSGSSSTTNVVVSVDDTGAIQAYVSKVSNANILKATPNIVAASKNAVADGVRRGGSYKGAF